MAETHAPDVIRGLARMHESVEVPGQSPGRGALTGPRSTLKRGGKAVLARASVSLGEMPLCRMEGTADPS